MADLDFDSDPDIALEPGHDLGFVHSSRFRTLSHIFPRSSLDWSSLGSVYGTKAGRVHEKQKQNQPTKYVRNERNSDAGRGELFFLSERTVS